MHLRRSLFITIYTYILLNITIFYKPNIKCQQLLKTQPDIAIRDKNI